MVLRRDPLLREDGQKQRRHREFDPRRVKRQHLSEQSADHAAGDPVAMVEQRHKKVKRVRVAPLRDVPVHDEGICLIRQGEDQIRLFASGVPVPAYHRNAVEKMPGVHHQRRQRGREKRRPARQQADADELHRAGKHQRAHRKRPEHAVSIFLQKNAKADAQHDIPRQHRQRTDKRLPDRVTGHAFRAESSSRLPRLPYDRFNLQI